jgi:hypothetical protein
MVRLLHKVLSLLLYAGNSALAVPYTQTDSLLGSGFLNAFSFQAIADPTNGRVWGYSSTLSPWPVLIVMRRNYVDAATAARENLTYASGDHFVVRADFKKTLSASGPGRDSVRLQSYKQYTTFVTVLVFPGAWMGQSGWLGIRFWLVSIFGTCLKVAGGLYWQLRPENTCEFIVIWLYRTWPALWTVGANWPNEVSPVSSFEASYYGNYLYHSGRDWYFGRGEWPRPESVNSTHELW